MIPAPAPVVFRKGDLKLRFNEPHEQGCITIECHGGGLCFFLDDVEMETLSKALGRASARIRANRLA